MKYGKIENLPEILTANHISQLLGIHRDTVYKLFKVAPNHGGIPNFTIGMPDSKKPARRAKRELFLQWLEQRQDECLG